MIPKKHAPEPDRGWEPVSDQITRIAKCDARASMKTKRNKR